MKRSYKLENLECAHCAEKMTAGIKKLPGVNDATIAFMSQRLNLEADDLSAVLPEAQKIITKIERNCRIVQ